MKKLIGTALCVLGLMVSAAAQVPVAIVEEVKGKADGVEFMDYVAPGKVIKLAPKASVVLGYMKSCWRETITGGVVVVGDEQSTVQHGDVQRVKADCDPNSVQLSEHEASQSAATTFRTMTPSKPPVAPSPKLTLYGLSPVVELKGAGTLVIERVDVRGERLAMPITSESLLRGKFYDLAKAKKSLTAGGIYTATLGSRSVTFAVAPGASAGSTPIVGRLLRL